MQSSLAYQLATDSGLLVLIWLVQLIIYPSLSYLNEAAFIRWHARYFLRICCIASPLILTQAAIELVKLPAGTGEPVRLLLLTVIWAVTALFSLPCHFQLHRQGKRTAVISRLIQTNWLRTVCWTLLFLHTVSSVFKLLAGT